MLKQRHNSAKEHLKSLRPTALSASFRLADHREDREPSHTGAFIRTNPTTNRRLPACPSSVHDVSLDPEIPNGLR